MYTGERWRGRLQSTWLVLLSVMVVVPLAGLMFLTACQPQETDLPFETIEQRDVSGTGKVWEAREPGLMAIANFEDLVQMDSLFTQDAQAQLREVNFDTYFAIAVFLGWQGRGHEGIGIEQVARRGNRVSVYVQVGGPKGTDAVTSPYHLVKIRKEGNWNQAIHFTLYLDGTEATSLSHFVP